MPATSAQRLGRRAHHLERLDDTVVHLAAAGLDIDIVANTDVVFDGAAIDELATFARIADDATDAAGATPAGYPHPPRVARLAVTPDFHKGAGVPIGTVCAADGFVVPAAVGNDVGCGMRLVRTDLHAGGLDDGFRHAFATAARAVFFEGGRAAGLDGTTRAAILEHGAGALEQARRFGGLWDHTSDGLVDADRTHRRTRRVVDVTTFADWVQPGRGVSYDAQIATIGGSNHFVELQQVTRIVDGAAAWALGLAVGDVCVMAHSGSRGLGHVAGAVGTAVEAATWPAGLRRPASGVVPVGVGHSDGVARYLAAVEGAANFAEANRAALVAAALRSLEAACGTPVGGRLVWDAPHNLVWDAGDGQYLHRKGATPAGGYDAVAGSDLAALGGEPVLVPGSMGAPSWILVGTGAELTCASACHGAGRRHARGTMRHTSRRARRDADTALDAFLEAFNVITPLDVDDPLVATRRDIVTAWRDRLVEEAPWAYKDVGPAIATLAAAGVARPAVELTPLATIKG